MSPRLQLDQALSYKRITVIYLLNILPYSNESGNPFGVWTVCLMNRRDAYAERVMIEIKRISQKNKVLQTIIRCRLVAFLT